MRRRWWIAGAGLVLAVTLAWASVRFTGGTLSAAFWYVLWHANLTLKKIPQETFWVLLLFLAAALAVASLWGYRSTRRGADEIPALAQGSVRQLAHTVRRAGEEPYYRWQLAGQLSARIVEAIDSTGQSGAVPRRQWWAKNSQNVPPEIREYVEAALWDRSWRSEQTMPGCRRALSPGPARLPLDLDLEIVVRFLEDQVEGANEHRQP